MTGVSRETDRSVKHERLHALDALRALAMMLGVWLHMAMPYTQGIPRGFWPADEQDDPLIGVSVLLIHSWRMELFFMLSGFFTAMLVIRWGVRRTASQRTRRIVFPFMIAMATLGTACSAIWGFGYANMFGGKASDWVVGWILGGWGIGENAVFGRLWHFWFLYTLIYLIAIGLIGHMLFSNLLAPFNRATSRLIAWGVRSWFGPFFLAIPLGVALILIGRPNGPDPATTLVPDIRSLVYYALPFFAGWYLYDHRGAINILAKRFWWPLTLALAVAFPIHIMSLSATMESVTDIPSGLTPAMLIASMTRGLLTVSLSLGLIGAFTRFLSGPGPRLSRVIRYFSDSAYWVYLAHMPLVAAMAVWIFDPLDWNPLIEMLIGVTTAMFLLIGSYELFVRYTPIGTMLNGKRTRGKSKLTPASAPAAAEVSARRANRQPHEAVPPRSS
ncbi:MAG: acyltransferase family protein [Phycisphaerales bacterium JB047]